MLRFEDRPGPKRLEGFADPSVPWEPEIRSVNAVPENFFGRKEGDRFRPPRTLSLLSELSG